MDGDTKALTKRDVGMEKSITLASGNESNYTYLVFESSICRALATKPYNWVGGSAYRLIPQYKELINEYWLNGATPAFTAETIHLLYMDRPVDPYQHPVMK